MCIYTTVITLSVTIEMEEAKAFFDDLMSYLRSIPVQVTEAYASKKCGYHWSFVYSARLCRVVASARRSEYKTPQEGLARVLKSLNQTGTEAGAQSSDASRGNVVVALHVKPASSTEAEVFTGVIVVKHLLDVDDLLFDLQQAAKTSPGVYVREFVSGQQMSSSLLCLRKTASHAFLSLEQRHAKCGGCRRAFRADSLRVSIVVTSGQDNDTSGQDKETGKVQLRIEVDKPQLCGRCGMAKYCNAACQKQDWATHKQVCKVFRAARRAAVGIADAVEHVRTLLGPDYVGVYPALHPACIIAKLPLLCGGGRRSAIECPRDIVLSSSHVPADMSHMLVDLLIDSSPIIERVLTQSDGFFVSLPEYTIRMMDDLNLLRSFTPTQKVMLTYDGVDPVTGRFLQPSIDLQWDINDFSDIGKKYLHDLKTVAARHSVPMYDALRAMHQLRIKRARGFTHIIMACMDDARRQTAQWFMLDEIALHNQIQGTSGHNLADDVTKVTARYASRYGGFLPLSDSF